LGLGQRRPLLAGFDGDPPDVVEKATQRALQNLADVVPAAVLEAVGPSRLPGR